jgi:hypothetical protein
MLLSEDSAFSHIGMYGTVLTAIAEGSHTVSTIANRIGRSAADVNHYVKGLLDGGFLRHCEDAFKEKRAEYQIADPLIRFHHAIVYPNWARLELYRPQRVERVWGTSQHTFNSQVVGPTFEQMCRTWTEEFADTDETLGGDPASVAQAVLNNQAGRSQLQLDIVVKDSRREVIAIGEAKAGETMATRHLTRLREATELLRAHHKIPLGAQPKLLLFSGAGFTPELTEAAEASSGIVQLVGLDRLYSGG